MKLLRDYILVEEPSTEEKSESGLIIKQDRPNFTSPIEHTVLQVGPDVKDVKEGDTVLYLPRSGVELKKERVNWRFLKEEEIIAIV